VRTKIFKLSRQITGNSINNRDFKFKIYVTGSLCDYSSRAPKNITKPLIRYTHMPFLVCGGALRYLKPQLRSINMLRSNAQSLLYLSLPTQFVTDLTMIWHSGPLELTFTLHNVWFFENRVQVPYLPIKYYINEETLVVYLFIHAIRIIICRKYNRWRTTCDVGGKQILRT
jgi:hypothetical protein